MLLWSSFRISPIIGADDIHNSPFHVTGILFPHRRPVIISLVFYLFLIMAIRIEAKSLLLYSGQEL
jgi:hypothetical protein